MDKPPDSNSYDVAIIGGGMVGASLACALSRLPLRVIMIETAAPQLGTPPTYDDRAIALSFGSRRILEGIGAWDHLASSATPIERIHVSDRGRFGFTHLDCEEEGVPALGYVALARELGDALYRTLGPTAVEQLAPAELEGFHQDADGVTLEVSTPEGRRSIHTRLVAAADGTRSLVREQLRVPTREHDYQQSAIITNVTPSRPHGNVAYERFTESGPIALLPMSENRCGLVWTWHADSTPEPLAWDDDTFLAHLQNAFGFRLGRLLRVGRRFSYPLRLLMAQRAVHGRVALIGNAMHTLHPVAGQGFNLGIRDVAALGDVVATALRGGQDPGAPAVLDAFESWRRRDQENLALITDGLARLFTNPLGPVRWGRNLGLLFTDLLPGARHGIARHAMGLTGYLPRLSRGLRLD
jgi:2-octaprenyl-6-methoxyphenol hydroxylase